MQACTQWTHSDVWSQLPTTPECLFKIGDRQSEKKLRNCDRRAICNATRGIDAGRGAIRHRGVSDGSDGARPLWQSHSARTEMLFADDCVWLRVNEASERWCRGLTTCPACEESTATGWPTEEMCCSFAQAPAWNPSCLSAFQYVA